MNRCPSFFALALLGTAALTSRAAPVLINHEDVIEGAVSVTLFVDGAGNGRAAVVPCAGCEPVSLAVSSRTKVVEHGRVRRLEGTTQFGSGHVDVFFLVDEREVTRFRIAE